MKKKILSFFLTLCLVLPLAFGLVACGKEKTEEQGSPEISEEQGNPEIPGEPGEPGISKVTLKSEEQIAEALTDKFTVAAKFANNSTSTNPNDWTNSITYIQDGECYLETTTSNGSQLQKSFYYSGNLYYEENGIYNHFYKEEFDGIPIYLMLFTGEISYSGNAESVTLINRPCTKYTFIQDTESAEIIIDNATGVTMKFIYTGSGENPVGSNFQVTELAIGSGDLDDELNKIVIFNVLTQEQIESLGFDILYMDGYDCVNAEFDGESYSFTYNVDDFETESMDIIKDFFGAGAKYNDKNIEQEIETLIETDTNDYKEFKAYTSNSAYIEIIAYNFDDVKCVYVEITLPAEE